MKRKKSSKKIALLLAGTIAISSSTYVYVKQFQYSQIINSTNTELDEANNEFVELIKILNKNKILLTSVGNSIATGYSITDRLCPLLIRNSELFDLLASCDIDYETYNFARMKDNCDERTYDYLVNNAKQSEINEMIYYDFFGKGTGVNVDTITYEDMQKFYSSHVEKDKGLNEIVERNNKNEMNIIVYNGGVGSFLDNVIRGSEDIFNCFTRDAIAIESFCKYVFLKNPNTQIYLCGIPNFLNLDITNCINNNLRKITESYPNVTYVESAPAKMFYSIDDGIKIDVHYDKTEYLCHNKNIIQAICDNYISNSICIDLHLALKQLNEEIQFKNRELLGNTELLYELIYKVLDNYKRLDIKETAITNGIDKFTDIYRQRYGYDYNYTSKEITLSILKQYKEDIKGHSLSKR